MGVQVVFVTVGTAVFIALRFAVLVGPVVGKVFVFALAAAVLTGAKERRSFVHSVCLYCVVAEFIFAASITRRRVELPGPSFPLFFSFAIFAALIRAVFRDWFTVVALFPAEYGQTFFS